jgi:hypothetical protein
MSNKRRLMVSIYHRDECSLGQNRNRLGSAAFHWAIFVRPKNSKGNDVRIIDVTDSPIVDPQTLQDLNPSHDWRFRVKPQVDPSKTTRILGAIMIGKLPNSMSFAELDGMLSKLPLPVHNARPEQNCVSWVQAAIETLQRAGVAEQFDIRKFMDFAIKFADRRIPKGGEYESINYTNRPM